MRASGQVRLQVVADSDARLSIEVLAEGVAERLGYMPFDDHAKSGVTVDWRKNGSESPDDDGIIQAVDCTTCGDTAASSVELATLPEFIMPANSRFPMSVMALAEAKYGQLGLVASVPP